MIEVAPAAAIFTRACRGMQFLRRGGIKTRGGDHTMSGAYPHFKPWYTHEELKAKRDRSDIGGVGSFLHTSLDPT